MSTSPPPFAIELEAAADGNVRIDVKGELDLSTSPQLQDVLGREFDAGHSVLLDLSEVTFIDSTGLNVLVAALRSCEQNGCRLELGPHLPAQVSRVFKITGLDTVLPISHE